MEVLLLLEHFLSDPLECIVVAHLRQNGLQTDRLGAHLEFVQAPDRCLLAISSDGDERGFPVHCLSKSPATLAFVQLTTFLWCSLLSIIFRVWLLLAHFCFLLCNPLHPGLREEIEQAGPLITLVPVLHFPAKQYALFPGVPPFPQADLLAIMLQLDRSPPLGVHSRGLHPLLLIEPLFGVFEGPELPLLGREEIQLLEYFRQAPPELFEDMFPRLGGIHDIGDGHTPIVQLLHEAVEVEEVPSYKGGGMSFRSSHTAAFAALEAMNAGRNDNRGSDWRQPWVPSAATSISSSMSMWLRRGSSMCAPTRIPRRTL